jgi:hypothetical protein
LWRFHFDGVAAKLGNATAQYALLNCSVLARTAIEKLKLGHAIVSIAATLFPSIASKNSKWKVDFIKVVVEMVAF